MTLIDTHTHIYLENFKDDFEKVLSRAREAGVEKFLLPNIDAETIDDVNSLAKKNPKVFFPMMGLHPCSVKADYEAQLEKIFSQFDQNRYVAVGEIGIDLYWDQSTLDIQREAFRTQIKFAKKHNWPIVIHARDSFDEIFEVVDEENDDDLRGVFHCFTGSDQQAQHILNYGGFLLGIGGVLTFKNSGLDAVLKNIDLKHIVLETDAPYLAPHPHRGKRNEPAYVSLVAQKLAEIHNIDLEVVARITTSNAKEMFTLEE